MKSAVLRRSSHLFRQVLVLAFLAVVSSVAHAQRISAGTGFFVTSDGYFVTCFHVVVGSGAINLRNLKGETIAARLVAADRANDIALLKAEGTFKPLPIGASADVRRGAAILTMGFPNVNLQGIEPKVTDGIINSFSGAGNDPRVFQISAPIQTGNSGGPLVDMTGNVIGIVASKLDAQAIARQTGDIPQNVNYAIKSQYLKDLLERAAAQEPALRAGLATPHMGEKARVVDVVPALEEAIALVIARAAPAAARAGEGGGASQSPDARAAPLQPEERRERAGRVVAEYRLLQRELNKLNFDELALLNQANVLKLMLRLEDTGATGQRREDLGSVTRKLEEVGTRKAQTIRRLNELAAEYRQLQGQAQAQVQGGT